MRYREVVCPQNRKHAFLYKKKKKKRINRSDENNLFALLERKQQLTSSWINEKQQCFYSFFLTGI